MSDKLLDVRNLSISFKSNHGSIQVVSDISFDMGEAEVFGLVGESGSGKSMTALSILRILPGNAFADGNIIFKERDLITFDEEEMRGVRGKDISIIFQEPMTSLNPVLTVGYQVAEALRAHFEMSRSDAMNKAIELLGSVRISSPEARIRDYPHQLSGGMRQRVMIAMAIACNPSLLIADEPTTALDVTIQAQILGLLQGLRRERQMAILLITHDLSIIAEQAERVAVMYAGRFMELAPVEEFFLNTLHPYSIGLLESLPVKKGVPLKPIAGSVPSPDIYPKGCKFADRCQSAIDDCRAAEPELLEVSKGHYVRCIR